MFFQHFDVRHGHAAVGRFAHVVNGQKANLNGGERFHFNAGGPVVSVVMKGWCFVLTLRFLMDE